MPRESSQFIGLSVLLIDSVSRKGKHCYSQVFLEECKYTVKEKRMTKYITDDMNFSSDFDREVSYEEFFKEESSGEENFDEKDFTKEN